jgi:hypothetical protein
VQLLSRLLVPEAGSEPVPLGLPSVPPQPRDRGMEEAAARSLRVTLRYFDGCTHWRTLYDRLRQVLREEGLLDVEPVLELVETAEDAERLRFRGSPTILIEGRDPFGGAEEGFGLLCRVYMTLDGLAGSPTPDQLRAAMREA